MIQIGVPEYWWVDVRWQNPVLAWLGTSSRPVAYDPVPSANHAINLNKILQRARADKTLDLLILLETDVLPKVSIDQIWSRVFSREEHVLASGIRLPSRGWAFEPIGDASKTEPFRANIPLGLVAIKPAALRALEILATWKGADEPDTVEIYVRDEEAPRSIGLDFALSARFRAVGYEPYIDPFLKTTHVKPAELLSWPG